MDILRFIFFALFIHFICRSGVIFMMSMVLCLLPLQEDVLAQTRLDDKVLDGQPHQRWLLCKGSDLDLVMDPMPSPAHCYKWYRRDQPGQAFALLPDEGSRISVNPVRTAWYRCERYPKNAQTQCSGVPDKIQYFKVYVVEGPDLSYMLLNGDHIYTRNQGVIGNPETMDEYIDYDLTGGVILYYYDDLDDMEYKHLNINMQFTSQNGEINRTLTINPEGGFQFVINQKMVPIPYVRQDGESKEYELKIQAEICGLLSEEISIKVKRLWIEEFKNASAPSNHMVVMDLPIKFNAFSAQYNCTDFKFSFDQFWGDPLNNTSRQGTNMLINSQEVYNKNLRSIRNEDLGDTHGKIVLSCNYFANKTNHILRVSNDPIMGKSIIIFGTKISIPAMRFMAHDKRYLVQIFFDKYRDYYPNIIQNGQRIPNWFYYWRFGLLGPHMFDFNSMEYNVSNDPNFIYYGLTTFNKIVNAPPPYALFPDLDIYDEASRTDVESGAEGIHCFNAVLFHEFEHVVIKREQFPNLLYDPANDLDGDLYNDVWETTNPIAIALGFKVRFNPDDEDRYDKGGNGYGYEEARCRNLQALEYENGECDDYDDNDWSYTTEKEQGKNWKKR